MFLMQRRERKAIKNDAATIMQQGGKVGIPGSIDNYVTGVSKCG